MSARAQAKHRDSSIRLRRSLRHRIGLLALAGVLGFGTPAAAQQTPLAEALPDGAPVVSFDAGPLGPIRYFPGRGVQLGDTGLTIGGFTTVEADDPAHEDALIELDSISFLVLYEPIASLRFFAEVEVGGLFFYEPERDDVDHDPDVVLERLYGDWSLSDALNLRLGKFQTPVGRWNLVPAEPFVWTALDPVQLDRAFDEHQTGATVFGTFYPGGNELRYWLYGQFVDPFDVDATDEPADRAAGGRIEYGGSLGDWSVGVSLLASELKGEWNYLAGLDGVLRLGALELQSEAVFAEGGIPDRDLWSVYLQGVYHLGSLASFLEQLYFVARFEHFDPDGRPEDANLWDLGFAWTPKPYLNFKLGYRLSDRVTDDVSEGLAASISVLF